MTFSDPTPGDRPFLDNRTLAVIVYVLYLIALGTGFTALIGFVIAWVSRPLPGRGRSHMHAE